MLAPEFERLLATLEARQERGTLWVPTLGALADRLRTMSELTITLQADGSAVVHAPLEVKGATFVVDADVAADVSGHAAHGIRTEGTQTVFWADLPAGDTVITLTHPAGPVPFVGPPSAKRASRP